MTVRPIAGPDFGQPRRPMTDFEVSVFAAAMFALWLAFILTLSSGGQP